MPEPVPKAAGAVPALSDTVKAYLKTVARGYVDGDDIDDERDAIWDTLTEEERGIANVVVSAVFEEYL